MPPGAGRLRVSLLVRLDPAAGLDLGARDEEFERLVRGRFAEIGVRMSDRYWAETPFDAGAAEPVVRLLEGLSRNRLAVPGTGHLSFRLEDDAERPLEWFELQPRQTFPIRRSRPYEEACAADVPAGAHAAQAGVPYVSEAFKRAVEEEGLTGLEFLWVKDVGRYRAPQWYRAVPGHALGRGLDHPWFDRLAFESRWLALGDYLPLWQRLSAESGATEREELLRKRAAKEAERAALAAAHRLGARQFDLPFFRRDASFGDPVRDRLFGLFGTEPVFTLSLVSCAIVLRAYLPGTSFAFAWGERGGEARDRPGVGGSLCFDRRTRDLLVGRALVRPDECLGVLVLDEPPPGAEVFDEPGHPPPPEFTPEEMEGLRVEERRVYAKFLARPRKERTATLEAVLKRLKAARRTRPDRFGRAARGPALERAEQDLGRRLPAAWRRLLEIADGFELPGEADGPCTFAAAAALPGFHRESARAMEGMGPAGEEDLLFVGSWINGDLLALVAPPGEAPGDCPVSRVDHESAAEARRWKGVAEALDELLGKDGG
jgi:hypothetical protein